MSVQVHDRKPTGHKPFPRGALIAAGALIGFTLLGTGGARLLGIDAVATPPPAAVAESRALRFEDRADGAVLVFAPDGSPVTTLEPGGDGFVRGVLRGLARTRKLMGIGPEPAFELIRWTDGRLSLIDPATGKRVELAAFGATNEQAFARFMQSTENRP